MASASPLTVSNPHRWKALYILSLAQFLIILDTSIIGAGSPANNPGAFWHNLNKFATGFQL